MAAPADLVARVVRGGRVAVTEFQSLAVAPVTQIGQGFTYAPYG